MRIVEVIPMEVRKYDILYVDFGDTVGSVQKGKRFAVVVSNNIGNKHSTTIMVVPTTTKKKHNLPTHFNTTIERESTVLCENIMTISKEQIIRKHSSLTDAEAKCLNRCLKIAMTL